MGRECKWAADYAQILYFFSFLKKKNKKTKIMSSSDKHIWQMLLEGSCEDN